MNMATNCTKRTPANHFTIIVIGGGIAGVTCAETLSTLSPDSSVLLLTASPLIKAVTNLRHLTKMLEEFDVEEKPMGELDAQCVNVTVLHQKLEKVSVNEKEIHTSDGNRYQYSKLCLCMGGTPKVIAKDNPYVLGIRDTETVKVFQKKLKKARRIVLVGNGGIATELAYEVEGCEVVWAVKDESISSTFIDAGAATFFLPMLQAGKRPPDGLVKRMKYKIDDDVVTERRADVLGGALGPDWSEGLHMRGQCPISHRVQVEYKVEVKQLWSPEEVKVAARRPELFPNEQTDRDDWPVYVELSNGKLYGCDFVVSATGVEPCTQMFADQFDLADDGGVKVNGRMETSVADVYAAGDLCHADWEWATFWVQMRLWSQARQMGAYAAKSMVASLTGDELPMDFCFELFAHVTKFFNHKVILLGKFSAQGMGSDHELLLRVTKGVEYVKVVMREGRMHGAILIGDTDLEETFENLILNQMDLSAFQDHLLDPDIDIDDFFD